MDNLRRFPAPWTVVEEEECFRVKDGNGFTVCCILHREDLHAWGYQYANEFLSRDEARRIAKAISRLPDLLKRPQY
ncbi:hypothetical protein GWG65_36080 [Bradyrhizobium sp. CSA207]|uniref:hypothetical protein n=1 Tax=Bradyrhizobium sp. CSA207 TaxID=2698826 RepID=UPI0023AEBB99|nr:hypothetical protein [Bradyrhizobium sp. CSA207]MDE5446685.1 hypothetical protein [Bradyrhizobium sp. CSA207]